MKGKTKSGIVFELDERIKDDTRLTMLLVRMQKVKEPMEASAAMYDLLNLIFGSEENTFAFMNEVAEKHDGVCSTDVMLAELTEMLEAIKAKN